VINFDSSAAVKSWTKLAVNVSAVQFRNSELVEAAAKALTVSKLPPANPSRQFSSCFPA
jgi:EAL domain-containing protein (putative c-di-GMP-specific phosphodiesterase class I)